MTSQDIIEVLRGLFIAHGTPEHMRSDNGPEFIAKALREWLERSAVGPLYIEPGSPWEATRPPSRARKKAAAVVNEPAESFHSKLRDEFLGCEVFESLRDATALGARWRRQYNEVRPHSSLGYVTPAEFARACGPSAPAAPQPPFQEHTLTLQS